jgi:hypothetical protein
MEVINYWPNVTEHNLTNRSLNRVAWLGQAAMAYKYKIPAVYSSGWQLLDEDEQHAANVVAHHVLNFWLKDKDIEPVTLEEAILKGRQVELY